MISFHASEDLLAVAAELIQLLLDDCGIQWFALLYQLLPLGDDLLDFTVVQGDLLLESLRVQRPCGFYTAQNDIVVDIVSYAILSVS